jgi:HD-like signal output (HDOD) protein
MASKAEYEQAMEIVESLNPSAHVLSQAQQKIRDPNVEIGDLERILMSDAGITADIIRISNSAFYSYSTTSKDLGTSINRLGFDELIKLIGLVVSKRLFSQDLIYYNMNAVDYWSESVSTGLMMEYLAKLTNQEAGEFYCVGLLSTVGKMVLNTVMEAHGEESIYDGKKPVHKWESDILGFNYAFAGAMILKRWDFPSEIITAIQHQFKIEDAEERTPVLYSLMFARKLIDQTGYDFKNGDLEIDAEMDEYIADNYINEEELAEAVMDACDAFAIIKKELKIS